MYPQHTDSTTINSVHHQVMKLGIDNFHHQGEQPTISPPFNMFNFLEVFKDTTLYSGNSNSSILNPFGFKPVPPQTTPDIVAFSIGCLLIVCNFLAMALVFTKYKKIAVRSKHPFLMALTLFFNSILFVGYSFNNGLLDGSTRESCVTFSVWFFNIGFFGWISTLLSRQIIAYINFRTKRKLRYVSIVFILLLLTPVIIYCIVASAVEEIYMIDGHCRYSVTSVAVNFTFIIFYLMVIVVMIILSRKVLEEFTSAATETSGLILIVASIFIALLTWILALHRIIPIRIAISVMPIFVGSYYFWSYYRGIVFSILTCSSEEYFINWLQSQNTINEESTREIQNELEESLKKMQVIKLSTLSSNNIFGGIREQHEEEFNDIEMEPNSENELQHHRNSSSSGSYRHVTLQQQEQQFTL